jgi:hypothetical protein
MAAQQNLIRKNLAVAWIAILFRSQLPYCKQLREVQDAIRLRRIELSNDKLGWDLQRRKIKSRRSAFVASGNCRLIALEINSAGVL